MSDPDEADSAPRLLIPAAAGIALAVCLVVTLVVGVWPNGVADLARDAVPVLSVTSG